MVIFFSKACALLFVLKAKSMVSFKMETVYYITVLRSSFLLKDFDTPAGRDNLFKPL